MKLKYLKYTTEELIDNKHFRAWILHGKKQEKWKEYTNQFPEFEEKVQRARKIILFLHENGTNSQSATVHELWNEIQQYNKNINRRKQFIRFGGYLKYAAVVVFALFLAGVGYHVLRNDDSIYHFSENSATQGGNDAKLVLSNGQHIALRKNESSIRVDNTDDAIKIDNDSVINMAQLDAHNNGQGLNEVTIPYGKKSYIELTDGTKVWLNAGSKFAFPTRFTGKKRLVYLTGEAYFEVKHNDKQPFEVSVEGIIVKDIGTRFNISAYDSDENIETVLLDGEVSLKKAEGIDLLNKEIVMMPGHKASFDKTNKAFKVVPEPNADQYITWIHGWYQFSGQRIDDVFKRLERYYNVKFIYRRPFPSSELIAGKLDLKDSLNQVLTTISDIVPIDYRISGNQVIVNQKVNELNPRN
ncbi:anti-sigma factor [Prolixibacter bellariivorans]|uniref:Anti-sigma factor n=1 Tax=Prolixibacter bellariivorans TaxID=314319 RepID=A0A5M4AVX1_9BACT|nr:FecR family protein [Prolixibacter bellariivorans]GET32090.1 anti-sigma factor [Prolixibacter bellariivorans]